MDSRSKTSVRNGVPPQIPSFGDFHAASRAVIDHLRGTVGLDLWMVTRTEGEDWIILEATENSYGISAGEVLPWRETFCRRMVDGAPPVAPRANDVPAYRAAPIGHTLDIGAYVGVPLTDEKGELFGTLCGIDPGAQSDSLLERTEIITILAKLLGTILTQQLAADAHRRRLEIAEAAALHDALTALPNRRAWDAFLAREQTRCERFGHPAAVVMIDVDGLKHVNDTAGHAAGDELLRRAAVAIDTTVRSADLAARIGGDEFAVLATETDAASGEALLRRLRDSLAAAGVAASLGLAVRGAAGTLEDAMHESDAAMYRSKQATR